MMRREMWCAFALLLMPIFAARAEETVRVNLNALKPGQIQTVVWHGLPIGIYKRTERDIMHLRNASLAEYVDPLDEKLIDSLRLEVRLYGSKVTETYAQQTAAVAGGPIRSLKPSHFVFVNLSTVLGCSLHLRKTDNAPSYFHDPCHNVSFDVAGRIRRNDAGHWRNLFVPPHRFISDSYLLLGESEQPPFTLRLQPDFSQFEPANPETAALAARWRDWAVLERSLGTSIRLDALAKNDYQALANVVKDAPIPLLQRAIKSGLDVNAVSPSGAVPLVMLLRSEDTRRMRVLLEAGADPNGASFPSGERKTPLHYLFDIPDGNHSDMEIIRLLLMHGADPHIQFQGESACSLAAKAHEVVLKAVFKDYCQRR